MPWQLRQPPQKMSALTFKSILESVRKCSRWASVNRNTRIFKITLKLTVAKLVDFARSNSFCKGSGKDLLKSALLKVTVLYHCNK
ncbi:hypothetical protein GCK32_018428 [Trichostrongylus colubriformis]|uniref:Uncharacterized protein n=1 Tax=Trichostrongylus colubriformis TaxID=6319 RepID=A0AAN8IFX7_TRICO